MTGKRSYAIARANNVPVIHTYRTAYCLLRKASQADDCPAWHWVASMPIHPVFR